MAGLVLIGAGPGLGGAVARRFAREGLPVALIARRRETVDAVAAAVRPLGADVLALTADSTDEAALQGALDQAVSRFGTPEAVVYNAALVKPDAPGELSAQGQLDAWSVNVVGALTAAAHVLPSMADRGSGSFLVSSGMPVPVARYVSLSLGKAGVRALVAMLAEHYGPAGVHAASVTVTGVIAPGTAFDPDDISEHYWRLHQQSREHWELEVVHGG